MKPYRAASKISPITARGRPPVNASTRWNTALNSRSHPTIIVTAAPAITGAPIASTPAAIISTLKTIDHVVADFTSPVNSFTRSDILFSMSPSFFCRAGARLWTSSDPFLANQVGAECHDELGDRHDGRPKHHDN